MPAAIETIKQFGINLNNKVFEELERDYTDFSKNKVNYIITHCIKDFKNINTGDF